MAGLAQGLQVVHVIEQIKITFVVLLMIDDRRPWPVHALNTQHTTYLACVSIPVQDSRSDVFDPARRLVQMAVFLAVRVAAQTFGFLFRRSSDNEKGWLGDMPTNPMLYPSERYCHRYSDYLVFRSALTLIASVIFTQLQSNRTDGGC